jgi:hypothetical protein
VNITIPLVGLALVLVVVGIVAAKQRLGWILLAILAGFLLAGTTFAPSIRNVLDSLTHALGRH